MSSILIVFSKNNTDSFDPSNPLRIPSSRKKELLFFFTNPIRAHSARSSAMASRSTISREEIADGIPVRHRGRAYLGSVLIEFLARSSFKFGTQMLFLLSVCCKISTFDAFDENFSLPFIFSTRGRRKTNSLKKKICE